MPTAGPSRAVARFRKLGAIPHCALPGSALREPRGSTPHGAVTTPENLDLETANPFGRPTLYPLVKEIVVILENHPGTLARVTEALSEQKINILGFTLLNSLDHGALRMVVNKPKAALHLLGEHDMLAFEQEVIFVNLPNKAGALSSLTALLAKKKINVEYAYGSAGSRVRKHGFYLRTSNPKRALTLLQSHAGAE